MAVSAPLTAVGYDVEALRQQQFPITRDTVYLNHAGISPLPARTYEALRAANERLMLDPSGGFMTYFMDRMKQFNETMTRCVVL